MNHFWKSSLVILTSLSLKMRTRELNICCPIYSPLKLCISQYLRAPAFKWLLPWLALEPKVVVSAHRYQWQVKKVFLDRYRSQTIKPEPCKDNFSTIWGWTRLASLWSEHPLGRSLLYSRHPSLSCLSCSNHLCSHNKLAGEVLQLDSQKELQDQVSKNKKQAEQELKLI